MGPEERAQREQTGCVGWCSCQGTAGADGAWNWMGLGKISHQAYLLAVVLQEFTAEAVPAWRCVEEALGGSKALAKA